MHLRIFLFGLVVCCINVKADLVQGICSEGYKECETGDICILDYHVCDGEYMCPDRSDEKYCIGKPSKYLENKKLVQGYCSEGYVECETGEICLQKKYLCDRHFYCPDESDEKYCYEKIFPESRLVRGNCTEGYVECEVGGICLEEKYLCDGDNYCPDKSDEKYCSKLLTTESITTQDESTTLPAEGITTTISSEELIETSSMEKEHIFALPDDEDHCNRYKRLIKLARKVHVRLNRTDKRTAKVIELLINEILMEADMENYTSLLELHKVCHDLNRNHHHHSTTTSTQRPNTSSSS